MRIGDLIYFAPGVRFTEVDLNGAKLPGQFECRISGYYLDPADHCSERGEAFAAGLVLVSCIDGLARLQYGGRVGERFRRFAQHELSSFQEEPIARRFYEDFRNGLVHEARIKRGGQFSLEHNQTLTEDTDLIVINPQLLGREVRQALRRYIALLAVDDSLRAKFSARLREQFVEEFA